MDLGAANGWEDLDAVSIMLCWKCGKPGHLAKHCKQQQCGGGGRGSGCGKVPAKGSKKGGKPSPKGGQKDTFWSYFS